MPTTTTTTADANTPTAAVAPTKSTSSGTKRKRMPESERVKPPPAALDLVKRALAPEQKRRRKDLEAVERHFRLVENVAARQRLALLLQHRQRIHGAATVADVFAHAIIEPVGVRKKDKRAKSRPNVKGMCFCANGECVGIVLVRYTTKSRLVMRCMLCGQSVTQWSLGVTSEERAIMQRFEAFFAADSPRHPLNYDDCVAFRLDTVKRGLCLASRVMNDVIKKARKNLGQVKSTAHRVSLTDGVIDCPHCSNFLFIAANAIVAGKAAQVTCIACGCNVAVHEQAIRKAQRRTRRKYLQFAVDRKLCKLEASTAEAFRRQAESK